MSDMTWALIAALLFIPFGSITWSIPEVRRLDVPARAAVAFLAGNVIGAAILYLQSLIGLPWNRLSLATTLIICLAVSLALARHQTRQAAAGPGLKLSFAPRHLALAVVILLCAYGAFTARLTCADLLYFWGPKAQKFFAAGGIDFGFLGYPMHFLMHPDYPPLQPIVWAATSIAIARSSYWGALLLTPLSLLAAALTLRGFATPLLGERKATEYATLLAAVLTAGFTFGHGAGGADPLLVAFEVMGLSALVFMPGRDGEIVAAIGLAGAAFTKVEGAAFVIAVAIAMLLLRRGVRPTILVCAPALALLASWIAVAQAKGLPSSYFRANSRLHFEQTSVVLLITAATASYGFFYLPWIAALAPLPFGRSFKRAVLPLFVAVIAIGYTLYIYLHEPDPTFWIRNSAERVLLTPLACLVVASAAASE